MLYKLADTNNISVSLSRQAWLALDSWVKSRLAEGDSTYPSASNLTSRLIMAFLEEMKIDPKLTKPEEAIRKAIKHPSEHTR